MGANIGQAKIISSRQVQDCLALISNHRQQARDRVMFLLSVRAGLRAGEIAQLTWSMVSNPDGTIGDEIRVHRSIAKKGSGRTIPLATDLRASLVALKAERGERAKPDWEVVHSERGRRLSPNVVSQWFLALYKRAGLEGCSSHSGRRTFITNCARRISTVGGSLKDVQSMAGHRSLVSTSCYIVENADAKRQVVNIIGK